MTTRIRAEVALERLDCEPRGAERGREVVHACH